MIYGFKVKNSSVLICRYCNATHSNFDSNILQFRAKATLPNLFTDHLMCAGKFLLAFLTSYLVPTNPLSIFCNILFNGIFFFQSAIKEKSPSTTNATFWSDIALSCYHNCNYFCQLLFFSGPKCVKFGRRNDIGSKISHKQFKTLSLIVRLLRFALLC